MLKCARERKASGTGVLAFIPRNETAQLMVDANKKGKLVLKYLRKYKVEEGVYKDELFSTLAPSVTGTNMYGDEDSSMKIIRSNISIGEKIRARNHEVIEEARRVREDEQRAAEVLTEKEMNYDEVIVLNGEYIVCG